MGLCAFSGTFLGLKLVPAKCRYLVPPQAANASRQPTLLTVCTMDGKSKLTNSLFNLRTPLHAMRGAIKIYMGEADKQKTLPDTAIDWITKWQPHTNSWIAEVEKMGDRLGKLSSEIDDTNQYWGQLNQHLFHMLADVDEATSELDYITWTDGDEFQDSIKHLLGSIHYVQEHYQRMRDSTST
jgi:hypothetical protein